jgi:ketosteroid isomerase-like protein
MTCRTPEEIHRRFTEHFTAGDLDALVGLYEADAVLIPQPGTTVQGHAAIRAALADFLALGGRFGMPPGRAVQAGDLALLYADWTLEAEGADGSPLHLAGQTTDLVRRQADGGWLIVLDNPYGAAGAAASDIPQAISDR